MKIQQIRNATIRIECAGKHFLIDPWFQKKGTGISAPSPDPEKAKIPSPTTELPFPVEQIMEGIDAMIVTHIHPDHFDPRQYLKPGREAIKQMVMHKIQYVLGCENKA